MKKYHFILLVFLGMFLIPISTSACGVSSKKHSSKKEVSSSKSKKNSFYSKEFSTEKENKDCNGCCGHSKCGSTCGCASSSVSMLFGLTYKNTTFYFTSTVKDNFSNTPSPLSDGYSSIWVIPKIS